MLNNIQASFKAKATIKSEDIEHRRKINFNISKYDQAVPLGKQQFADLEKTKQKAKKIRWKAIEKLDNYLEMFEENISKRGAKVLWAADDKEALHFIGEICKEKNCKTVVKSKSMITEEIHLNKFLQDNGILSLETDLGEYIQQLDDEPPYHIVTPAMHKNKEDIAKLFTDKLGVPSGLSPKEITLIARNVLRDKFRKAEIGITGANFILADIGGLSITENEGNARLCTALPKTHIVVVGIEKMIPSVHDLNLFLPLLATYGTGQRVTVYNSIITGPRQIKESDGPEEMYVILLDNGRTNILKDPIMRQSLYCIRCGACLNTCPIYKNIGGHAYETTYSGPIGSVITPWLKGMEAYNHLSFSSSLCGSCTEVCPVKIDLHQLLLHNRRTSVIQGNSPFYERVAWKIWKTASLNRSVFNQGSANLKNWILSKLIKEWCYHRDPLKFSKQTFNEMWQSFEEKEEI